MHTPILATFVCTTSRRARTRCRSAAWLAPDLVHVARGYGGAPPPLPRYLSRSSGARRFVAASRGLRQEDSRAGHLAPSTRCPARGIAIRGRSRLGRTDRVRLG